MTKLSDPPNLQTAVATGKPTVAARLSETLGVE